jgi:exopolysaccharide biosynthesis polyprenyl glycosylphosphotransferase
VVVQTTPLRESRLGRTPKIGAGDYAVSGRGTPTLERHELPVAEPVRRRFGPRLPWGLGAFREGEHSREVLHRDTLFRRALATADAVSAMLAFVAVVMLGDDALAPTAFLLLPLVVAVGKVAGLYDRDENLLSKSTVDELPALFQVATVYALVLWLSDFLFVEGNLGRSQVVLLWGLLFVATSTSRAIARRLVLRSTASERCMVLGSVEMAEVLRRKIDSSSLINATVVGYIPFEGRRYVDVNAEPAGSLPVLGSMRDIAGALWEHRIDRVLIDSSTIPAGDRVLDKIRLIKSVGVRVSLVPRLLEVVGWSVALDDVGGIPLMGVRGYGLTQSSRFLKRSLDVCGSLAVLALMAPLFVGVALAVKLTSRGPVLFRQKRVGRNGRQFNLLKFRTMYDGADAQKPHLRALNEADGLFKIANDPRITPVGRVLRRMSVDELPQLVNVLRGEMSLVGPRPLVVEEDNLVQGWLRRRLDVTPGMTGVWQVLGSARIPLHEMVKLDYLYRANWTLWLDLKILLRTVPFVFARRGL